jgi:hypothetical protein
VPHSEDALRDVARVLTPALPVRAIGRAAMRLLIGAAGTTAMGPGAAK